MSDDGLLMDQASARLTGALRSGAIRSGQFLSLSMLVEALGLPLAAVREAVKRAESLGFVTVLPKRGVQVMEADAATTRACMDLRAVLDTEGARRLIAAGLPDLAPLRTSHRTLIARATRGEPGLAPVAIEVDLGLHGFLASGLAGNPLLRDAYEANRIRVAIIQNTRAFLPDRIVPAMEEHLAIMDALESGVFDRVAAAIRTHYRQTLRWWGIDEG